MRRSVHKLCCGMLSLLLTLLLLPAAAVNAAAVEELQAVVYHNLTVDPNGGAFADGSTEAKTFRLRSTGYLSAADNENAGFKQQYAGLTRSGFLPLGFGTDRSGAVTVALYDLANTRFTEDTTLYVLWGKTVQLTIDANGGILFGSTPSGYAALENPYTTTVPAGDVIPVSYFSRMAVRDGWSFAGLTTDEAGNHPVPTWRPMRMRPIMSSGPIPARRSSSGSRRMFLRPWVTQLSLLFTQAERSSLTGGNTIPVSSGRTPA